MKKLYLINSDDKYLQEEEIDHFIKENDIDTFSIVTYDYETDSKEEIIQDIITPDFLNDKKLIIVNNFSPAIDNKDKYLADFMNILTNEIDNYVIFTVSGKLANKALVDIIKKQGHVKMIDTLSNEDIESYVTNKFIEAGYVFDPSLAQMIVSRSDCNLSIINQEINKLLLYKEKEKEIDYRDINLLVSDNSLNKIYELIDAFVKNDKKALLDIYNNFMAKNTDELQIMNAFIAKLEEIYYTKSLISKGMTKEDIASYYNVKPARAYYIIKAANQISDKKYKELVRKVNQLDYNIKSGYIDKKLGLELFLLGA